MWHKLDIESLLHEVFDRMDPNTELLIFGDPAYKGAYSVIGAFVQQPWQPLTNQEQYFNTTMSSVHITIGQLFRRTLNL